MLPSIDYGLKKIKRTENLSQGQDINRTHYQVKITTDVLGERAFPISSPNAL